MAEKRSHKIAANRIARKFNAEYNQGEGVDINTKRLVIEIETPETVNDGIGQLRGFRKPVYIAGSNQETVNKALDRTKNTTIGVMDSHGNIIKRSIRKK